MIKDGFGIDFGTTNSIVAKIDSSGKVKPFTTTGNRPHPSVVWLQADGETRVGMEAKRKINEYSDQPGHLFVSSVKRHLGREYTFPFAGRHHKASSIASAIFSHLLQHAREDHETEIREAIVTIPVTFHGRARRELSRAADEAGLFIKTFVYEPFAAVVGHIYHQKSKGYKFSEGMTALVFDWGGGTLDVTIARLDGPEIRQLAIDGLSDIAGDTFDRKLLQEVQARFLDSHKISPDVFAVAPGTKDRFINECERAKISLSNRFDEKIQVANLTRFRNSMLDLSVPIQRTDFEHLIQLDVEKAMTSIEKTLERAGLRSAEIDLALLIGGTSRIPLVQRLLHERFGSRLVTVENADTIIAEGAAIIDGLGMKPILDRTIGVQLSDGANYPVFKEGMQILDTETGKNVTFFCTDNRDGEAHLIVTETGRKPITKEILNIPVSPNWIVKGHCERVEVRFDLDPQMILHVTGKGATRQEVTSTEIHDLCFGLKIQALEEHLYHG